jgi:hypothetical protein
MEKISERPPERVANVATCRVSLSWARTAHSRRTGCQDGALRRILSHRPVALGALATLGVGCIAATLHSSGNDTARSVDPPTTLTMAGAYTSTFQLNLRTFGNTSLTLELNLSTFGTYPRV